MSAATVIAITGATGFTGRHVVRAVRRQYPDARVQALVRTAEAGLTLEREGVVPVAGDLHDGASLDRLLAGAHVLLNIASLGFPWVDSLFAAIGRAASLRRGVFVSTTAILTTLPVRSKPLREHGERLVRESGIDWTLLRPTMIYGTPDDRNIIRLIALVDRLPIVPVPVPRARQQPVHVADVANAVVEVLRHPATVGRAYNIAGGAPLTLKALVEETAAALGRRRTILPLPFEPLHAAARLYAGLVSHPRITVEQIERLREDKAFPYDDAARDFGYAPRTFRDGVADEVRLYRARRAGTS